MPLTKEQKAQRRKDRRAARKLGGDIQHLRSGPESRYREELPLYDGMEQCANATGIPYELLVAAKKEGCTFVKHGKVHLSEFIRWFFSRPVDGESNENWAMRDKRAAALLKEAKLQEEYKRVIDFDIARRFIEHLAGRLFFAEFERYEQEFPASAKGKSELEILAETQKQTMSAKANIEMSVKKWVDAKGQV